MRKIGTILTILTFSLLAYSQEYQLIVVVKDNKDFQRLNDLGFKKCQKLNTSMYVCAKSDNINYVLQLRDFLEKNGFRASVSNSTQSPAKSQEKSEKVENINIGTSKDTPVLKDKQNQTIKKVVQEEKSEGKKSFNLSKEVKPMYEELNAGNYSKALEIAENLKETPYKNDAKFVIGLINLKNENFEKACSVFKEIQNVKPEAKNLVKDSCYVYHMKLGYEYLEKNDLKRAYENFKLSLSYKDNVESKIGIFYTYLRQKDLKEAEREIKSLYNKYPNDKKVIQAYIDYLIETNQIDELRKFENYLTEEQRITLKSKSFYKDLDSIKKYIDAGEYEIAESKLKELYLQNPSNIYVLLNLGYLYLKKEDLEKAESYYRNVLFIDSKNIDALKGLKAVYIKTQRYEEALDLIEKLKALGVYDQDEKKIRELILISKAQEEYRRKNLDLAEKYALEVLELNKNNPVAYLILANVYKDRKDEKKFFQYITKAYQLDPNNTGIKIAYLYGLTNLGLFDQVKTILSTINPKNLSQEEKDQLKEFYQVFYGKLASYYLNTKNYSKAKRVALEGLEIFPNDSTLLQVLGWSCYNLKDYKCSEKIFNQLLLFNPEDENAKLGLAYTYLNLKKVKDLENLLSSLEKSTDKNILKELATIYYSMGRYKDAERIIKKYESTYDTKPVEENIEKQPIYKKPAPIEKREREVPFILDEGSNSHLQNEKKEYITTENNDKFEKLNQSAFDKRKYNSEVEIVDSDERFLTQDNSEKKKDKLEIEEIKQKIKLQEQDYVSNVVLGVKFRDKSGESGKSKLTDTSPFLKLNYYFNENLMVYVGTYFTNLDSGTLKDYNNFGTPQNITILRSVPSSYSGIEPFAGFSLNSNYFDLNGNVGLTPKVNNGINSKFIYDIEGKLKTTNNKISIGLYQRPIRDSILSYVGTADPYSYKNWGRAVGTGVKASYEQSIDEKGSFVYTQASIEKIKGQDIQENTNINLIVLPKIFAGKLIGDKDYLGLFFLYSKYSKDQDCYYYGCGGYFSPKNMFIVAPMLEGFYFMNERFGIHYKVFLGGLLLKNNDKSSTDLAFDGYLGGVYMLRDNIFLNLAGEYRKTSKYSEIFTSAYLQYFFGKRYNITENDLLKLEKEIYKR